MATPATTPSPFDQHRPLLPHLHGYKDSGLWTERTLAELARERAFDAPDAVAITAGADQLTFAQLLADAEALAVSFQNLGLSRGDRVCYQLPNWAEVAVINLALALAGLVGVPIVPIYRDAEMRAMLADSRSRALVITDTFRRFDYGAMAERLKRNLPELEHVIYVRPASSGPLSYSALVEAGRGRRPSGDPFGPDAAKILLYTSGTTGRAKGVLHSQNTLNAVLGMCVRHWDIRPGDAVLMPSPVTHLTGYGFLELPLLIGSSTMLMESWDAEEAVRLIDAHSLVGTVSATPFLKELIDAAEAADTRLQSLRFFACGGAAVPPALIRRANGWLGRPVAFRIFGCTEAPLVSMGFLDPAHSELAATTDGQIKDYEVRIVDDQGAAVSPGQEGEIIVRGPAMMLGYLDPQQTAEAIDGKGFYHTGDIGLLSAEGAVIITGRKKDLIIRGGENISAKEVEDVLHRHPAVAEAAVVAMPHERLGETGCAFVVLRRGELPPDEGALISFVAGSGLARQKVPEHVKAIEEMPRTSTGKIRKDLLRDRARGLAADRHIKGPRGAV